MSHHVCPSNEPEPPPVAAPKWSSEDQRRIEMYIARWVPLLGLDRQHINISFADTPAPDDVHTMAVTRGNHPYESAHHIVFYLELLKIHSYEMQERAVVHELVHIITSLAKDVIHDILVKERFVPWHEAKKVDERMTDWIANVVFRMYRPS